MTHRRLFLWLFTCSTALLLVPWAYSMFRHSHMTIFTPGRIFDFTLRLGTMRVEVESEATRITHHYRMFWSTETIPRVARTEFGDWGWGRRTATKHGYPPGTSRAHLASTPMLRSTVNYCSFKFPLLLVWLFSIGVWFVVCRPLARRFSKEKAKALAAQTPADDDGGVTA
ncbi:MAG: hypothetical protein EOP88_12555 [Verrucomicrobiaceae bacterium]|nr:MAG: hypothetical protein EOP88_12555 [Verrucomicrobiaceae bacterium]